MQFQKFFYLAPLLFAPTCWSESVADPRTSGERIVAEALAALGGPSFLAMQDRVETGWTTTAVGEVSRHLRTRIYTVYRAGAMAERRSFDKDESHAIQFDETGGYEVTWRGVRPLDSTLVEQFREQAARNVLNILKYRLTEPGLMVESRGSARCQNQSGELVDITDSANHVTAVCFSRTTRLPIFQTYVRRDPETRQRIEELLYFSRFTDAGGGVVLPRLIEHLRDGEPVSAIYVESAVLNQRLTLEQFPHKAATELSPKRLRSSHFENSQPTGWDAAKH